MKAKILVVEDSPTQGARVVQSLESMGYDVRWAKGGIEALRMAKDDCPDVVILDVVMDDMDGYSVCRWLKLTEHTRETVVIMLTVKDSVDNKVEGLNVGADDYLPKPVQDKELEARIYAALRSKTAQKELKRRNQELESLLHSVELMAMTDSLTGIYNRRRFTDILRREWASANRYRNPISLMMADIDHFKRVNDEFGHSMGDLVLKQVATMLSTGLREVDVAARYGGEEFVVLLPHTRVRDALTVADRIMKRMRETPVELGDTRIKVTISIGLASNEDDTMTGSDDLLKEADRALYRAKMEGRDRIITAMALPRSLP